MGGVRAEVFQRGDCRGFCEASQRRGYLGVISHCIDICHWDLANYTPLNPLSRGEVLVTSTSVMLSTVEMLGELD